MEEGGGGGGGGGGARDTESKTRTPHKDVGNKKPTFLFHQCLDSPELLTASVGGARYPSGIIGKGSLVLIRSAGISRDPPGENQGIFQMDQWCLRVDRNHLQLWPWLPVISGYFYGIIHSINKVISYKYL